MKSYYHMAVPDHWCGSQPSQRNALENRHPSNKFDMYLDSYSILIKYRPQKVTGALWTRSGQLHICLHLTTSSRGGESVTEVRVFPPAVFGQHRGEGRGGQCCHLVSMVTCMLFFWQQTSSNGWGQTNDTLEMAPNSSTKCHTTHTYLVWGGGSGRPCPSDSRSHAEAKAKPQQHLILCLRQWVTYQVTPHHSNVAIKSFWQDPIGLPHIQH